MKKIESKIKAIKFYYNTKNKIIGAKIIWKNIKII